jgi:sigma-B regulation protein RsbU (phosphoserine phosphatase)
MKREFHSFATRLTRSILLVMLVVMTITSGLIFLFANGVTGSMVSSHYQDILKLTDERVEGTLSLVEVSSINNVGEIAEHLSSPEDVCAALLDELRLNAHIVGCGMGFIQNYFPSEGHWFEPYAQRMPDGTIELRQIGSETHDYLQAEWFLGGLEATDGQGYWSDPYYDDAGAGDMLCTYALPLRDESGRVVGVFGADLSLTWLTEQIGNLDLRIGLNAIGNATRRAYSFILGRKGDFIAYPDPSCILTDNFFNHVGDGRRTYADYEELGHEMLAGGSGDRKVHVDGVLSHVYFAPLLRTGWSMCIVLPESAIAAPGLMMGALIVFLLGLGLLVAFLLFRGTVRRTVRPLKHLAHSADEVAQGHFDTPLPVLEYHDEIRRLRDSFEHMQLSLTQYIEELKTATAKEAMFDRDLEIANRLQMSMLPKAVPSDSGPEQVEIYGELTPAKAVGGDLYDYCVRDGLLYFCIGDVSGKGIPAAFMMAVVSAQFRMLTMRDSRPDHMMRSINEAMCARNESMMFVTLFIGTIDLATGKMEYCNAGHDAPVLIGADGTLEQLPVKPNLPVGIDADFKFAQQHATVPSGTSIFLYTDGVTEAENPEHALFGMDRLLDTARKTGAVAPDEFLQTMKRAVRGFADGAEQSDDLTMLVIRYNQNN